MIANMTVAKFCSWAFIKIFKIKTEDYQLNIRIN